MFMELYKFSRLVVHLNSCSMDLGRDTLHEAKVRYLPLENVILAVVHATHKLPHYFQSHTVVV